ncbi:MAG: glycosyltransferase family 4 protein [Actinomycetota bacterium]|nr:glycosyltransferase family 4 protein [Actinomycetota bacterium]
MGDGVAQAERRAATPVPYLVGSRYAHHSGHSGYEGFGRHVGRSLRSPLPFRYLGRGWRLDAAVQSLLDKPCYSASLLVGEVATAAHMAIPSNAVYHVLYGDTDLRLLGSLGRRLGRPVVATFHEPAWGLDYMKVSRPVTRDLAAAILVSETQRPWFSDLLPPERVAVVPHGVDCQFFQPPPARGAERTCLVVGSKYRDFDTLEKAIDVVHGRDPSMRFVAIGTDVNTERPLTHGRVQFMSGVDDAGLRRAYQEASVVVFPLRFATANNALLEAMACGAPIVASDVGGVSEYLGDGGRLCPPFDPESLAEAIVETVDAPAAAARLGESARERALRYDFPHVAGLHRQVYSAAAQASEVR